MTLELRALWKALGFYLGPEESNLFEFLPRHRAPVLSRVDQHHHPFEEGFRLRDQAGL